MTLREWCAQRPHGEIKRLARTCGMSREHISAIVNCRATPSCRIVLDIWRHTKGQVPLRSLLDPKGELEWPEDIRLFDADPEPTAAVRAARAQEVLEAQQHAELMRDWKLSAAVAARVIQDAKAANEDVWLWYDRRRAFYRDAA